MKHEHLQKIENTIGQRLDRNEFEEYGSMIRSLHSEILNSDMKSEEKIFLIQKMNTMYMKCELIWCEWDIYYEKIIQNIKKTWAALSCNLRRKEGIKNRELSIKEIEITQKDRDAVKIYNVKPLSPDKTAAYIWGKARIIGKYILDLPITEYDLTDDTDMLLDSSVNRAEIAEIYACDTKGLKHISPFDKQAITKTLQEVDCSLNQLIVTNDKIFITPQCEDSLRYGKIYPWTQTRDLYGKYVYETLIGKIYTGKMLRRMIKPLTDARAKTFEIPRHNLEIRNLESIEFWRNILAHIRNYLEKPDKKQIGTYYRLAHILKQMNLINNEKDIFPYLSTMIEKTYPEYTFVTSAQGLKQEANRLMKKLLHLIREEVAIEYGIQKDPLQKWYVCTSTELINIQTTLETPDKDFEKEYHIFKQKHKNRFTLQ